MRFMSLNFNCFKRGNNLEMKRKYLRGKNMLTFSLTRGKCLDRGGGRYLCRGRREQKSKEKGNILSVKKRKKLFDQKRTMRERF